VAARAALVDAARDQFLAGAALAGHQHGGVGRVRHLVDAGLHVADRRRQADQLGRRQLAHAVLQPGQFVLQLPGLQHAPQHRQDAVGGERLLDHVGSALAHRLDGVGDRAIAGQHHDVGRGIAAAEAPQHRQAVGARQVEVQEDEVEAAMLDPPGAVFGRTGGFDVQAFALQQRAEALADPLFVVDDQDAGETGEAEVLHVPTCVWFRRSRRIRQRQAGTALAMGVFGTTGRRPFGQPTKNPAIRPVPRNFVSRRPRFCRRMLAKSRPGTRANQQHRGIMGLRVNTNVASINAQRNLSSVTDRLSGNYRRLSTGLRISTAADDAAGLAISERLRSQVRSLEQAKRNANDGISFVQTAEGALNEVSSILVRLRELAVQASNGSVSNQDKDTLDEEFQSLVDEVNRIGSSTEFNGIKLLDGSSTSVSFQVGFGTTAGIDTLDGQLAPALSTSLSLNSLDIGSTGVTTTASMQSIPRSTGQLAAWLARCGAEPPRQHDQQPGDPGREPQRRRIADPRRRRRLRDGPADPQQHPAAGQHLILSQANASRSRR
jgi:hypothetical protein